MEGSSRVGRVGCPKNRPLVLKLPLIAKENFYVSGAQTIVPMT